MTPFICRNGTRTCVFQRSLCFVATPSCAMTFRYETFPPLLDSMKRINERTYGLVDYFDKL